MKNTHIIIVTYNAMQWLPKYLESTKPYSVIIVDNNSQDNTVQYIENQHPEIALFKQQKNLGFGQANNLGISHALNKGADYVFLLNQDACLQDDCIEKLVKVQLANTNFGILSPIHLNGAGDKLDHIFSTYLSYARNKNFYSDFILNKPKKAIYPVPFVNAAGWLISRECIEAVGGFDPIFFHYGEDVNYCQRVNYHNFKIGVVPDAFLKHDREERKSIEIKNDTPEYWQNMARSYKVKFADINKDDLSRLESLLKGKKKSLKKSLLKLNFSAAAQFRKEVKMYEEIIPEVKRSKMINKQPGLHYLSH